MKISRVESLFERKRGEEGEFLQKLFKTRIKNNLSRERVYKREREREKFFQTLFVRCRVVKK